MKQEFLVETIRTYSVTRYWRVKAASKAAAIKKATKTEANMSDDWEDMDTGDMLLGEVRPLQVGRTFPDEIAKQIA